ncbi:hypothetical protein V9T40_013228 [Parthenolecanium corni]|uniref:Senescence domain-containing protein n=1 Tax=Parthenolecanium corni TaxID=536013 RepID=A0AAN9TKZ7_9HEMI
MDSNLQMNYELMSDTCSEFMKTATTTISQAAILEQNQQWLQALKQLEVLRKEADDIMDEHDLLLSINSENLPDTYRKAIANVKLIRNEIVEHISKCNYNLYTYVESVAPPSYEEAVSTTSSSSHQDDRDSTMSSVNLSYNELGSLLENVKASTDAQSAQVIYSCEDVTLYFILSDGSVTTSNGLNTVRIFEVEDGCVQSSPKYYLQVFIYVYPLLPGIAPCIRTEFGAIILPNIEVGEASDSEVQSIGLLVPREKEPEFITCLENILQTKIVICDTKKPESTSAKISEAITTGAGCLSKFLIQSAQKAEEFMNDNTPKLIEKINASRRTRRMSPCLSNGIKIARDVTSVTAGFTGFIVSHVGAATYSLGQYLAPHIKEKGSQLLINVAGVDQNEASGKIDALFNVSASAVEGLTTVYQGLEQSARIFGGSLSNNTVQIVKHRYGPSAAEFTQHTFETVGNGVEIGTHLRFFKPASIVKHAAKAVVISKTAPSNTSKQKKSSVDELSSTSQKENVFIPVPSTSKQP